MVLAHVEPAKFHRLFYPVVPVVVVAATQGRVGGMAAISCVPVSLDPPLVALAVAPTHYTYELLRKARQFSVNWLGVEHAGAVAYMGSAPGRGMANKVEAAGLRVKEYDGIAAVGEAHAVLVCTWRQVVPTGDHSLVLAAVHAAYASRDFDEYWRFRSYRPALYVGGGDAAKGADWFRTLSRR